MPNANFCLALIQAFSPSFLFLFPGLDSLNSLMWYDICVCVCMTRSNENVIFLIFF